MDGVRDLHELTETSCKTTEKYLQDVLNNLTQPSSLKTHVPQKMNVLKGLTQEEFLFYCTLNETRIIGKTCLLKTLILILFLLVMLQKYKRCVFS